MMYNKLLIIFIYFNIFINLIFCQNQQLPGKDIQSIDKFTLIKTGEYGGKLYTADVPNSVYDDPIYVMDLHGTRFEHGYDAAFLIGEQMVESYHKLLGSVFGEKWYTPALKKIVEYFLDWQWNSHLSKQVPDIYMQEIDGIKKGGEKIGIQNLDKYITRGILLANFPGDLEDIGIIINDQYNNGFKTEDYTYEKILLAEAFEQFTKDENIKRGEKGIQCSNFGVWGNRTKDGNIYTGRNLDWEKDTGISKYKLITILHPPNKYTHATIGFSGLWGSLTSINEVGLTAHEANLESKQIKFDGFPWVLRLRYIMENANDLKTSKEIWDKTNSTVGFLHMVGSLKDKKALMMETMAGYTAYFYDNDEREKNFIDENGHKLGYPLKDAVYRSNHGFDNEIVKNYLWNNTHSYESSKDRYKLFHDIFKNWENNNVLMGPEETIEMVGILGKKNTHYYECIPPYDDGSNILAVAYDLANLIIYASWENGEGKNWTPASCNTFIKFDMKDFL